MTEPRGKEQKHKAAWGQSTPQERRVRLDELGAQEKKTDNEWAEHDALATLVGQDEMATGKNEEPDADGS